MVVNGNKQTISGIGSVFVGTEEGSSNIIVQLEGVAVVSGEIPTASFSLPIEMAATLTGLLFTHTLVKDEIVKMAIGT